MRAPMFLHPRNALLNIPIKSLLQPAGAKEGDAAQAEVEADDEDFDPEGGNVADEAEQVRMLV